MTDSILPLKLELEALDFNDRDFYRNLTDEQRKVFSAWIIMRYSSSCNGSNADYALLMTNELVNVDFSVMSKHPELQWMLLSLCGTGRKEYRQWIAPPKSKKKKNPRQEFLSMVHPGANSDELDLLEKINTDDDIRDSAKSYGYDDKQIKEILVKK